jgi:Tfp pilus assembly protein PilF
VSLIADSLKKAVKEKSAPIIEADPTVNPVARREPIKRPGLAQVFGILLLIVLPAGILVYLITIDAFSFKKTPVTQKPQLPVSVPVEEARVAPPGKLIRKVEPDELVTPAPAKPAKKATVEKKVTVQKPPVKPLADKKEKTVIEKKVVLKSPAKKQKKPERATNKTPVTAGKEVAALSAFGLEPESPKAKVKPDPEKKADVPKEVPVLIPAELEIPDHEIATRPEPSAKPSVEAVSENTKVSREQKTPEKQVDPAESRVAPVQKKAEAVVEDENTVVKPSAVEAPGKNVVGKKETPVQTTEKRVEENLKTPAGESQKKNPEVAALTSPSNKPEIFRVEPKDEGNVFENSDYYFNRGIFFQQAGDWQKALANYSKSEALDPNNPDTYNNKGVVLKEMGKYDQALDEFLRAVFLDSGYAKAYNNIGVVYFMKENYHEAIRHYLKAIDINPTNLEAFNNLATIYKKQKESEKARGVLNRALSLNPDHPGTNYNLAVLYEENKEIKPALYFYRRFIELGARNYPSLVVQVKEHLEGMKTQ